MAAGALRAGRATATPWPVKAGAGSAMVATTATAMRAAPRLNARRGGASWGANRMGASMTTTVTADTPMATSTRPRLAASDRAWPTASGTSTRIGQCHRYKA